MKTITIKYFTDKIEKLTYIDGKSDWIDLRAAEDVALKAGEFKLIPLGVAMKLPQGYEAHVVPRSSTRISELFRQIIAASLMSLIVVTMTSGIFRPMPCGIRKFMSMTGSASSGSWSTSQRSSLKRLRS